MDVLSRDAEIINVKEQKRVSIYVVAILVKDPYIDKYFAHSFIHSFISYLCDQLFLYSCDMSMGEEQEHKNVCTSHLNFLPFPLNSHEKLAC